MGVVIIDKDNELNIGLKMTEPTNITTSAPNIEPLLFTKPQAAEMLSLSESSIEWLIRKGAVPHRKVAGKIRFTRSDLQALIDASAVTQCYAAEQKGA